MATPIVDVGEEVTELQVERKRVSDLEAELEEVRSQLQMANLKIEALQAQLPPSVRASGVYDDERPPSVNIPDWLFKKGKKKVVRFAANDMPEWLSHASSDLLADGDEDGDASTGANSTSAASWQPVPPASLPLLADGSTTFATLARDAHFTASIAAHALVNGVNGHIEHEVTVGLDDSSWAVRRRYREFKTLHAAIQEPLGLMPFSAPKLLLHTPTALLQRAAMLDQMLDQCIVAARWRLSLGSVTSMQLYPLESFLGLHGGALTPSGKERISEHLSE